MIKELLIAAQIFIQIFKDKILALSLIKLQQTLVTLSENTLSMNVIKENLQKMGAHTNK